MLDKTLRLLKDIPPGTKVPDDVACFDPDEIDRLGVLLNKLAYAPPQLRERLQRRGATVVPANFYSEIPLITDIQTSFETPRVAGFDRMFARPVLARFLEEIAPYAAEFDPPGDAVAGQDFYWKNKLYSFSDAMSYYCIIRHLKPATIVEFGSGFSTAVADAAMRRNGIGRIICVDPHPRPFVSQLRHVSELIEKPAQDMTEWQINSYLRDGDFIFIDSTHTVKHDSDCIHIYLKILPDIKRDIMVHVHDIKLPRTLSREMMLHHQLYWTEQYLLYAYLIDNFRTEVLYGSAYNFEQLRPAMEAMMHGRYGAGGAAFWFSQTGLSQIRRSHDHVAMKARPPGAAPDDF